MTSYYVSTTGNNVNPGTLASPFRTFQKGVDSAVNPGDAVFGRAGIFYETVSIKHSGSAGAMILIAPYPGETVTIDGGAAPAIRDTTSFNYIEISGLILKSTGDSRVADYCLGQSHFPTGSSNNWYIHGNVIYGHVFLMGAYNLLENNIVYGENTLYDAFREYSAVSHHNIYRNNTTHDCLARGFWTDHYTHDGLWEYNVTDNCRSGFDTDGYGNVVWLHTIRHNTIYGSSESGVQLENTWASLIESNIIYSCPVGVDAINYGAVNDAGNSPHITLVSGYGDATDGEGKITSTIIRQNSIYTCPLGVQLNRVGGISIIGNTIEASTTPVYLFQPCPQLVLKDNILSGPTPSLFSTGTMSDIITDDHNLFSANPAYEFSTGALTLAAYQTASGLGAGSLVGDPLLTAHIPGTGSPALDAGTDIGVTFDILGILRPQGSGFDIGAYEVAVVGGGGAGGGVGGGGGSGAPVVLDGLDRIAVQDVSTTRRVFATINDIVSFAEINLNPNFGGLTLLTISVTGLLDVASNRNVLAQPNTGTTDDLLTIAGMIMGELMFLTPQVGCTITLKNEDPGAFGADQFFFADAADIVLTFPQTIALFKRYDFAIVNLYEGIVGGGGGGTPTPPQVGVWYGGAAPQSIANNTLVSVLLATSLDGTITGDFTIVASTQITAGAAGAGNYLASGFVALAGFAAARYTLHLVKNGTDVLYMSYQSFSGIANPLVIPPIYVSLVNGDYLELVVDQNTGASSNTSSSPGTARLTLQRVE